MRVYRVGTRPGQRSNVKTQYYTATSVDGYLADEDGSLDWLLQFGGVEEIEGVNDDHARFVDRVGALAMGSTTYEWIVEHEDLLEHPEEWAYEVPAWVFSTRELPAVEGADVRFVEGDVASVHAEMVRAAGDRNVWLVGGGDLVGQFHDVGLLDEIVLSVAPVTLASGAPLLPRRITDPPLKLLDVERRGDVFAVLTYEVQRTAES
jgi:dihydrofolate reductase